MVDLALYPFFRSFLALFAFGLAVNPYIRITSA
jgi:hypothetical protein